jgi:hypothetical protein
VAKLSTRAAIAIGVVLLVAVTGWQFLNQLGGDALPGRLEAEVRTAGRTIAIRNRTKVHWDDLSVVVNGEYQCRELESVDAGTTASVELSDCVSGDGRRFNPVTHAPTAVLINAKAAYTGEKLSGSFAFAR